MPYLAAPEFLKLLEPAIMDVAQYVELPPGANRKNMKLSVWESQGAILVAVTHLDDRIAPVTWPLFTVEDLRAPVLNVNLKARLTKILLDTIAHQANVIRLLGIDMVASGIDFTTDSLIYNSTERYSVPSVFDMRPLFGSHGQ